jgi:hypothetical protein
MTGPPGLRHAVLPVTDTSIVHVFEQPGYDPAADGIKSEIGRRGRLDHVGFLVPDVAALEVVRDRLVAVGASEGVVTPLGFLLSVHFCDPDGFEGEINSVNPAFDLATDKHIVIEHELDSHLYERLVAACARHRTVGELTVS